MRVRGGRFLITKKCYRIGFRSRKKPRFLQPHICDSKEGRRIKNHSECKTSQQIHKEDPIQNADCANYITGLKPRGLGRQDRSERRLFSDSSSRELQEVPEVCGERKNLPVQSAVLWPVNGTKGVYKSNGGNRCLPPFSSSAHFPISRRLANKCKIADGSQEVDKLCSENSTKLRPHNKLGKIMPPSLSKNRIPGDGPRPSPRPCQAMLGKVSSPDFSSRKFQSKQKTTGQGILENIRLDGRMRGVGPVGTTTNETNTDVFAFSMAPTHAEFRNQNRGQTVTDTTPGLVEKHKKYFSRCDYREQKCSDNNDFRCIEIGLGSAHRKQPNQWGVEFSNLNQAHKLAGDAGSVFRPTTFQGTSQRQYDTCEVRQHNGSIISEQARGDKIPKPVLPVMAASKLVQRSPHNHSCGSHSRKTKCNCRQTIKRDANKSDGMVPSPLSSVRNISNMGATQHRSVCISKEQKEPGILFSCARSTCPSSRCLHDFLGGDNSLRVPTSHHSSQSTEENKRRGLHNDSHSSSLAQASMVSSDSGDANCTPNEITNTRKSTFTVSGKNNPPRPRESKLSSVETVKEQKIAKGFSERTANTMAAARRQTTSDTYDARINRYSRWCKRRDVNPFTAPVTDIADFLQELFDDDEFSPSTIAGYKSAISLIHKGVDGIPIGQNQDLSNLLTGMYHLRPVKRNLVPNWSLPLVLNMLNKPPFEPLDKVDVKYLTLKTVFLIAVTSGRRVSEIHALSADKHHLRWESNGNGVRLLTNRKFLAKNESLKNPGKDIFLSRFQDYISCAEEGLMCPCRALSIYLNRTKPVRESESRLFLTFKKGSVHGASKDTLARWIVSTVKTAYAIAGDGDFSLARAHDTRSLATSWALFQGVKLQEIMRAAFWAAETTFTSFYMRDVMWDDATFSLATLGTARLWRKQKKNKSEKKHSK